MLPVILTVAGSDPSGGAGIQADLMTIGAAGGYGATAVAALTVQNSRGLLSVRPVEPELVREQMQAILLDMPVAAVKTGMLARADVVDAVSAVLGRFRPAHVVVDPVMGATSGGTPMDRAAVQAIRSRLLPQATLLTPNVPEAERLTALPIRTVQEAGHAGHALLEAGAGAVLVKGGHLPESPGTDVLVTADGVHTFPGRWQDQPNSHGTGCVLSSAIATFLGLGDDLYTAVLRGKAFLAQALHHGRAPGTGPGAVNPLFRMTRTGRIGKVHVITDETLQSGFRHADLALLAARGGADTVQYREKRPIPGEVCTMALAGIRTSLADFGTGLIVDDRVQQALDSGALGVHLGRNDMPAAKAREMLGPDAIIGVTANSLEEAIAASRGPVDYLGVGPVFGTLSKDNPAPALGLDGLGRIVDAVRLPVVAIGGINSDNAAAVIGQGAYGVAVLSAVACAKDPEAATRNIVEAVAGKAAGKVVHDD